MPTLVLVRHAQAAYSYPDHARPLTQAGVDQAARLGGVLAREIGSFDVAVCSDATRAQQTFAQISQRVSIRDGGVWVFRTVCFERVVLSSPGCLWPGRMDDHEEVLEAHA